MASAVTSVVKPLIKPLIHMINLQVTKALCMSINGFFQKNAQQLLSVISKRINHITAEGNVTQELIKSSTNKLDAAITKILDSDNFQQTLTQKLAERMAERMTRSNVRTGGGFKKTFRNISSNVKKTKKNRPKKSDK